jgi:hypothetical protein
LIKPSPSGEGFGVRKDMIINKFMMFSRQQCVQIKIRFRMKKIFWIIVLAVDGISGPCPAENKPV